MAKRRPPPPRVHPLPRAQPVAEDTAAPPRVDFWELATALVVALGVFATPASPLHAYAQDVVVTTAVFEFAMALLAAVVSGAEKKSRGMRIALVVFGTVAVTAAGTAQALALGVPGVVVPGLWIVAGRVRPPRGVEAFGVKHCRAIAFAAGAGWATLLGAFVLLMFLVPFARVPGDPATAQPWVYAVVWGSFYTTLAFVMPFARRAALRGRAGGSPANARRRR